MASKIHRMLHHYEFLDKALAEHENVLAPEQRDTLRRDRDDVFLAIVKHVSADPAVTFVQLRFLLETLTKLCARTRRAGELLEMCQIKLAALELELMQGDSAASVDVADETPEAEAEHDYAALYDATVLDSLSDRVCVFDAHYRYIFTNTSNAAFHQCAKDDIVGLTSDQVVGDAYFRSVAKPMIDAGFAGRSVTIFAGDPVEQDRIVFSMTASPMRNASGEVVSVLVLARDVSNLKVPERLVVRPAV